MAFGKGELEVELRGDHLRHKRAANQGPDHDLDALGRQAPRQLARKGHPAQRAQEQQIEIKPQIAVVTRFQDEMSVPGGEEIEKLLFHTASNLGMLRPCPWNYTPLISVACLIVVLGAGPTVTLILANSIRHGTRAGLVNVLGTQVGLAVMIGVVGIGLTSLIEAMGHWFDWLRLAGAAYLIWLGWKMIRSAVASGDGAGPPPRGGFLLQGALVALSNPKTLVFFGAFFPQFIDPARDHGLQILIMGLTAMLFAAVSDSAYALAAGRAGRALSAQRVRLMSRVSGAFLVGGGMWLAFSRR